MRISIGDFVKYRIVRIKYMVLLIVVSNLNSGSIFYFTAVSLFSSVNDF